MNTASNQITLQLSNAYEMMPQKFKELVPKTHMNLADLMNIYYDIKILKNEKEIE